MKKYEKPQILIERFELSQNVAACDWDMNNASDKYTCFGDGSDEGYENLFVSENSLCDITEDIIQEYCYTPAATGNATFNS